MRQQLDQEAAFARLHTLTEGTYKTRLSQWKHYLKFCQMTGSQALPATSELVCRYIAYMARSLKYTSIINYLSAVNYLHKLYGYTMGDIQEPFLVNQLSQASVA